MQHSVVNPIEKIQPELNGKMRQFLRKELKRRFTIYTKFDILQPGEMTTSRILFHEFCRAMDISPIGKNIRSLYQSFKEILPKEIKALHCIGPGRGIGWRETLGIINNGPAQFLFRGSDEPIKYWDFVDLAKKGTDVILCRKEGIVELLQPYAEPLGVAIITNCGFAQDYVKSLVKYLRSKENKANVFVLTDFDAAGLVWWEKTGKLPCLGVDSQMIRELGLLKQELEQQATPRESDLAYLWETDNYSAEFIKRLAMYGVEIEAVLASVKIEKFWQYLKERMEIICPKRRLSRSITVKGALPLEFEALKAIVPFVESYGLDAVYEEIEEAGYEEYQRSAIVNVDDVENKLVELGKKAILESNKCRRVLEALKKYVLPICEEF
ncbi:MAG: hypothetical protein NWE91_01930 [Candidatus Bathyarchaeota archaeon]|nr:hypothetical protein [Candidatus Bathyarchaeota archaeon]